MDIHFSLSAYIVFEAIAGVGFVFLVLSLVFGEILGRHWHAGPGPDFFSSRALSAFALAFGLAAMTATSYGSHAGGASLAGAVAGTAGWGVEIALQRLISRVGRGDRR